MDPIFWYGLISSAGGAFAGLMWLLMHRHQLRLEEQMERDRLAWENAQALEDLRRWTPPPPRPPPPPPTPPPPRDVAGERAALQKWFVDPVFAEISANIRLTKERVLVGTRKTGERFLGVLDEESQVPADSVDIRPLRSMDELTSALPAEWAMDEDLFDIRLAQGEMLVQVPVQHIPLMEDIHEPIYKDVVHTVYVLLDISPSMFPEQGEAWRMPIWKGLTLKVLFDTIRAEATFTLRPFSSRAHPSHRVVNEMQALDLGKQVVHMGMGDGTNILAALQAAVADFEKLTYDTADILIITDGEDGTELAKPLRGVLDEKRIKLHAVMLGQKNESLRTCCDSYQIVEYDKGWVKLNPVVTRTVQVPTPAT